MCDSHTPLLAKRRKPQRVKPAVRTIPVQEAPTHVLIDLTEDPPTGFDSTLIRFRAEDHVAVNKACAVMKMTKTKFLRIVVVNAARKVLKEAGVE